MSISNNTLYHQAPKYIIQDELTNIVQKREERNTSGKIASDFIPRHLTICNQSRESIYFSEQSETLYYIDARSSTIRNIKQAKIQKILKTDLILRNIKQISYNTSGNRLLIISDFDIHVISIPEYKSSDSETINTTIEFSLSLLQHSSQYVKACWHPLSDDHIVALDSDSVIRIIQVSSGKIEEIPLLEQTVDPIVSFSFGSKKSWERFTIYLTTNTQALFALCPVIPSGCIVSEKFLAELINSSTVESELYLVKHFLSGIISNVTDDEENREVTLKTSIKDNHVFSSRLIPIHNQSPSDSDISDMITINQNSNLPSCLVTVNTSGVVHLFAITDDIKPLWKMQPSKVSRHPYVVEANCLQEVLTEENMDSSLSPYLTLHPLSYETVYCVHERGANEITFPYISTMFTETVDELQFSKTVSCPLFISTELVEQPKAFAILHDILYGTTIFYIENKNQRVLISSANIPVIYDNEESSISVYNSDFSNAIDNIVNNLHKPVQINKSWNKLEMPFVQVSENTAVAEQLISFTLQKLKKMGEIQNRHQQALEKLTIMDSKMRQSQNEIDDRCKELYDKHKELHDRIKRIYELVFIRELNKEEKQFIKDIREKDKIINAYNQKLESTKRLMENSKDKPINNKQENGNYTPEIMEKIATYLDKTTKIIEATKEELLSIKQK